VVTNVNAAGEVVSIEKIVYSIRHGDLVTHNTVVFPPEQAWATYTNSGFCSPALCHAYDWLYPSPPSLRQFIASHRMRFIGRTKQLDGRPARRLDTGSPARGWADPVNDEVLQYQLEPIVPVEYYRWFNATTANLRHLSLSIPSGYSELASKCAQPVGTPIPPGLGNGDPCTS
jgi:hypothetical protein